MPFPTSSWPQKLPFGAPQFLCLFWPRPLLLLLLLQAVGTVQALFPVPRPPGTSPPVRDGVEFTFLPKKVTSDQPFLGAFSTTGKPFPITLSFGSGCQQGKPSVQLCWRPAGFWDEQDLVCPTSYCQLLDWQPGWRIGIFGSDMACNAPKQPQCWDLSRTCFVVKCELCEI